MHNMRLTAIELNLLQHTTVTTAEHESDFFRLFCLGVGRGAEVKK